mmetsp:Transcript_30455/g.64275  ORF Transcript_30455/g.64275 Transcript_30455/m.64275 type:complete len:152 (-) Transcript_30455:769-1224(-)
MAVEPTVFAAIVHAVVRAVCSAELKAVEPAVFEAAEYTAEPTVFAAVCSAELTADKPTTFASPPSSTMSLQQSARPSSQPIPWPWGQLSLQPSPQPSGRSSLQRSAQSSSHLHSRAQGLHRSRTSLSSQAFAQEFRAVCDAFGSKAGPCFV